jgi:hypothetical protein
MSDQDPPITESDPTPARGTELDDLLSEARRAERRYRKAYDDLLAAQREEKDAGNATFEAQSALDAHVKSLVRGKS